MTRISTFCVVSSTLTVLALSANGASAGTPTVPTARPTINFHPPVQQPKGTSKIKVTKTWDSASPNLWRAAQPNANQSNQLAPLRYNPAKY